MHHVYDAVSCILKPVDRRLESPMSTDVLKSILFFQNLTGLSQTPRDPQTGERLSDHPTDELSEDLVTC